MTPAPQPGRGKAAPKNRLTEISPARKAAFDILLAVARGHSHSDDLLRGKAIDALAAADRNLTTALVLGVLRWQIRLDRELQQFLKRPGVKLDREVLLALRLGAFQILHMNRIPARAAIDESVELAKRAGHRFASAMVNAVLRKLAGLPSAGSAEDAAGDTACAEAHPDWMVERWIEFYGVEAALAICRHGQFPPVSVLRLADAAVESELAAAGLVLKPGSLMSCARRVVSGDVLATSAYREGRLRMQDEGSQLVAELAAIAIGRSGERILDACAAPGGKTLILAERNPQACILACESSEQRCEQLRRRLAPFSDRVECRLADAAMLAEDAAFDLVLADVPCSGTGTLGRNPEIRHRLRLEDLPRQAERQRAILSSALRAVKPGGRVVYSTCSLEPEENEQVIAAVLNAMPNARQVSLHESIDALIGRSFLNATATERLNSDLTNEGALRLLPGTFGTDGFFIALIERIA